MHIILDTNFILISTKNKIHLFEELQKEFPEGKILIPIEVINELREISEDNTQKVKDREFAKLSLDIIKKKNPARTTLGKIDADAGIIRYAKQYPTTIIATLDRNLKDKIKTNNSKAKFLTITERKRIVMQ